MEDIIYEHDYAEEKKMMLDFEDTESSRAAWDYTKNAEVMQAIGQRFRELPHIIIPQYKLIFEECEQLLDKMALFHGGRIRSVISYETFDAHIYLDLPFFEFYGEEQETLKYIANNAHSVTIVPSEDGRIRLSVRVDYFEDIGDKDAIIQEEIMKHPKLVELLTKRHEEEKDRILSDPQLYSVLERASEGTDMTPEEWLDFLETVLHEHPEAFMELLEENLKQRRKDEKCE